MTFELMQALFKDYFKVSERFTIGTVMIKLKISRPTATKLISKLLTSNKAKPTFQIGDAHKWYVRVK